MSNSSVFSLIRANNQVTQTSMRSQTAFSTLPPLCEDTVKCQGVSVRCRWFLSIGSSAASPSGSARLVCLSRESQPCVGLHVVLPLLIRGSSQTFAMKTPHWKEIQPGLLATIRRRLNFSFYSAWTSKEQQLEVGARLHFT